MNTVMANSSDQPLIVNAWPRNYRREGRRVVKLFGISINREETVCSMWYFANRIHI
jgi:hypothetical protein